MALGPQLAEGHGLAHRPVCHTACEIVHLLVAVSRAAGPVENLGETKEGKVEYSIWLREDQERVSVVVHNRHVRRAQAWLGRTHADESLPLGCEAISGPRGLLRRWGRIPVTIPDLTAHQTVHAIASQNHVGLLDGTVCQGHLDAVDTILYGLDPSACAYKALIWQIVVQYL